MKPSLLLFIFIFCSFWAFSQSGYIQSRREELNNEHLSKEELSRKFLKYDFSGLFTQTDNSSVYGFIGNNYKRIRIKLISVTKDSLLSDNYNVYGKSMVGNNICEFRGTIKIANVKTYKSISMGVDSEYKNKRIKGEFAMFGNYSFLEKVNQKNAGAFKGVFQTDFYLDRYSKIHYDDLDNVSDGFTNNRFTGRWTSYSTKISKNCNWGDFRIPDSGDFDIGAGDFSPTKNLESGWQTIVDLHNPNPKKKIAARKIEEAKWWK